MYEIFITILLFLVLHVFDVLQTSVDKNLSKLSRCVKLCSTQEVFGVTSFFFKVAEFTVETFFHLYWKYII